MRRLRDPDSGCPWDQQQTFQSIAPYTIEEAYEVADAINNDDMDALREELGDLLLQVVYHSQIATEAGAFSFEDVESAISAKMIRRHPHVFSDDESSSGWENIKAEERKLASLSGALDGVAKALPALKRADKLQKRAARTGFDWPDKSGAKAKILEELTECENAENLNQLHEEIGDLLFSAVNYARHNGIDPETALSDANQKFERRFKAMETMAGEQFSLLSLEDKEALWQKAKKENHK